MSEARADLPPQDQASAAMGLRPGMPPPASQDVALPVSSDLRDAPGSNAAPVVSSDNIRDAIKAKWIAAGATPQGAEGIVRRIQVESGFDPMSVGDTRNPNGPSLGLYQHHADRAERLIQFAKSQGKSPLDPMVQTDHAIQEVMRGGDPMASQHAATFMKAADPGTAYKNFTTYFERPASLSDMMHTPVGSSAIRQRMQQFDADVASQADHDRQEYDRISKQSDPGSKERSELMTEARQRAQRSREMYEDLSKNPPVEKPIDALTNFGSFTTILAVLIGGMAKHHLNGALGAAGAMMQAGQANNHEQFERQFKIWDHQTNMALNLSRLESDEVRQLLEDRRMSDSERQARLHSFYEEHNMTFQAQQLRAGMMERVLSAEETKQRVAESVSNQKYQFSQMMAQQDLASHPDRDPAEVYAKWGIASAAGVKAESDPKVQTARAFQDKIQSEKGRTPTYDDWVQFSQTTKGASTGQLSPEAVKLLAKQYETGDPGVITSLPRGGPGRIQVENQVAEDLKDLPGGIDGAASKIVMNRLRMAEAKSAATTAGRVTMNTEFYATEAAGAGKQVVETSKLFPRTNYPRINQAIAAWERNTGDPNVIKFGAAINSLLNAYGKMSNPTGTGIHDADKERLQNILDTSLSQGQIEAAVSQIVTEGRVLSDAARAAQLEVLAGLAPSVPGAQPPSVVPRQGAAAAPVPADLPPPAGHAEGSVAKDDQGKPVAVIRNGQWAAP